jgi:F-type H+-transporting ATPase subunit b
MKTLLRTLLVVITLAAPLAGLGQQPHPPEGNQQAHGAEKAVHKEVHPSDDSGEGHHAPRTYFGIPATLLKIVNMILFVGLLVFLLKGPVGRAFAERKSTIRMQLAEAEVRRSKAETLAADIDARLRQMEEEVQQIRTRAAEEGERQKRELIAASQADAEKILSSAKSEVDARLKQARAELTAFAAQLATTRATEILRNGVNDSDRQKIFADSVQQVSEKKS